MGAFNVTVVIPKDGSPSVEHSIAIAMEPHRGRWDWYAIGGYDWPETGAVILRDGRWMEPPEPDWQSDYVSEYGDQLVIVRCKG